MNCVVREISAGGAKLEFSDSKSIPDSFDLVIPSKEQNFLVKVRWRQGNNIGVEFIPRGGTQAPQSERDNSLLKLEYENALLRRQIAALASSEGQRSGRGERHGRAPRAVARRGTEHAAAAE